MAPLQNEIKELCTAENCRNNDFIILPATGDTGFEEYCRYKSHSIDNAGFNPIEYDPDDDEKDRSTPLAQQLLILSYPPANYPTDIFNRFFDSPRIAAANNEFHGLFAIDVSAYIGKEDDEHFLNLLAYIYNNPNAVYILFIYSDNEPESDTIYTAASSYNWFRRLRFELPSPEELTEYTRYMLRDFAIHIENGVTEILINRFRSKPTGYDYADYMHGVIASTGFDGSCEALKALIAEIDKINEIRSGYGY